MGAQVPHRDETGATPAIRIVEKVAQANGTDPLALAPLSEAVPVDALNALVAESPTEVVLRFEYEGYTITVRGPTQISLAK